MELVIHAWSIRYPILYPHWITRSSSLVRSGDGLFSAEETGTVFEKGRDCCFCLY